MGLPSTVLRRKAALGPSTSKLTPQDLKSHFVIVATEQA